jgi:hypothetical protein
VSFVFISRFLPEQTKIGSIYDKYILSVTPEKLKSLDIAKMWKSIVGQHDGINFINNYNIKYRINKHLEKGE